MRGRRDNMLPEDDNPRVALAAFLRGLRINAGTPSYRRMGERVGLTGSVLSTAANGQAVPSLPAVRAYVRACGGNEQTLATAERLWREAAAFDRGALRPVAPQDVRTLEQFVAEINLLLSQAGLWSRREIERVTTAAGCRVSKSAVSRWLTGKTMMPVDGLTSLLTACALPEADRTLWRLARARAERAVAGLDTAEAGDRPAMYVVDNVASLEPVVTLDRLNDELRELRKGHGIPTVAMASVRSALQTVCQVTAHMDDPATVRTMLIETLSTAAAEVLPEDLHQAFRVMMGLHPEFPGAFLNERVNHLARVAERDERTMRRKGNQAVLLVAQHLYSVHKHQTRRAGDPRLTGAGHAAANAVVQSLPSTVW